MKGGFKAILVQSAHESEEVVDAQTKWRKVWRENSQGSLFVLHFLQDGHNHVEFGPLGRIFVHADSHKFADVG